MGKKSEQQELNTPTGGHAAAIVALCTLVGLVLRVELARRSGIWADEAQFLWIVRIPTFKAMIDFLSHHESHPPLFYILMRGWLAIFGDSERAALALPVLLGTALIPASYYVGKRAFSRQTGLSAALLIAVVPLLALYSGFVRPYSLLPVLCLGSTYLLWRGLHGAPAKIWVLHVIVTLAMLLTHHWAWMVVGAEAVVVIFFFITARIRYSVLWGWLLAQFALVAGYSPWLPALLRQARHAGHGPCSVNPLQAFYLFTVCMTSLPLGCLLAVAVVLIFALVSRMWHQPPRENRHAPSMAAAGPLHLFLAVPLIAYSLAVVLSYRSNLYSLDRCLIMLTPGFIVVIAHCLVSLRNGERLVGLLGCAYLILSILTLGSIKSNSSALAASVTSQADPADLLVIAPFWVSSSFDYYYCNYCKDTMIKHIVYPYNYEFGMIDYNRTKNRLLDPAAMARFRVEIDEACRTGRRIWLVRLNDPPETVRIPTESNEVPSEAKDLTYADLGHSRADQIIRIIESKFDKPIREIGPPDHPQGMEILRLSLYQRGDATLGEIGANKSIDGKGKGRASQRR